MTEIQFLENVDKIIEMLLKNAKHSFGLNFKIINDTDIELHKRLKAEQLKKREEAK